ncbi:MAG: protoporphyrinogen oxidase [Candidatus Binatia bacterium]
MKIEDSDPRSSILETLMTHRIIVVGGGIAGLAAAHRVLELAEEKRLAVEVLLLEAGQRLGGTISTERASGFLLEGGPDGFITEKPWAMELCRRLNLTARLISTRVIHRSVYVVHRGALQPLPEGFFLLAPSRLWPAIRTPIFSWRGKARMALEPMIPRRGVEGDESLASFVRRRFGNEVLDRVAQPLAGGIYGADPATLSLAATFPRFLQLEKEHGSIVRGMRRGQRRRSSAANPESGARYSLFVTFEGGMQELVDALVSRIPEGAVRLGKKVTKIGFDQRLKKWVATTHDGECEGDGIVLAAPAPVSAEMLSKIAPELSRKLAMIPYASTATVNLGYRRNDIPHPLDAFGFVVPAAEKRSIMACTFSSVKYEGRAPEGSALLRAFVGGMLQASELQRTDEDVEAITRRDLADLVGVRAPPLFCRVQRHPRSMPQYRVGHLELVESIEGLVSGLPGLALAGSAYRGVGIPDCVRSGEEAAEKVLNRFLAD